LCEYYLAGLGEVIAEKHVGHSVRGIDVVRSMEDIILSQKKEKATIKATFL
jgi:hypothetical protein